MNDQMAGFYLREIDAQCRYALGAILQLNYGFEAYLKSQEGQAEEEQQRFLQHEIFRALHSFVHHTGNVASLLWPRGEDAPASRGSDLCARVDIDPNSLLNTPQIHAESERFAQRLTAWIGDDPATRSEEVGIGPLESGSGNQKNILCWYDPNDKWFVYLGQAYDVQNLATAIEDLRPAVNAALEVLDT